MHGPMSPSNARRQDHAHAPLPTIPASTSVLLPMSRGYTSSIALTVTKCRRTAALHRTASLSAWAPSPQSEPAAAPQDTTPLPTTAKRASCQHTAAAAASTSPNRKPRGRYRATLRPRALLRCAAMTHHCCSWTGNSNVTSWPVRRLYTPAKVSVLYSVVLRSLGSSSTLSTLEPSSL